MDQEARPNRPKPSRAVCPRRLFAIWFLQFGMSFTPLKPSKE